MKTVEALPEHPPMYWPVPIARTGAFLYNSGYLLINKFSE
jgi:hypothetical protein